jgi:hypothetical protein
MAPFVRRFLNVGLDRGLSCRADECLPIGRAFPKVVPCAGKASPLDVHNAFHECSGPPCNGIRMIFKQVPRTFG